MKTLFLIIVILLSAYVADKLICLIYCRAKKRQMHAKTEDNNNFPDGRVNGTVTERGVKWQIKQLLYGWIMYSLERLGRSPFQKYRIFILRHIYMMDLGKNVVIYHGFHIRAPWNIHIGKGTIIGDGASLDGRNCIYIGENVNISTDCYIYTEQHDIDDPYFESKQSGGAVVVGDRAWLSSRTTILPRVTVGEGAVLASGALATKDLDSYGIYGGIPSKKIGERSRDLRFKFDGSYIPFY